MATHGRFPSRGVLTRPPRPRPMDLLVLAALVTLLYRLVRLARR